EGQQVAPEIIAAHNAWIKGSKEIVRLMLMTMEPEIQRNLENLHANDMLKELKTLTLEEELSLVFSRVAEEEKNAASGAGGPGIFTIELNTFLNRSWIYDTGCGTHICNTTQGLRASRKLKPGALSLYAGNGQHEAVEAIGVFYLYGFINRFMNNTIQVSRNSMVYFSAITKDGIFEIDLSNSYANDSSIYAIRNKRAKPDLGSALLWHYRLGHISKKRTEKLQHDGLLNSTDLRAFEKCVTCMSGKMVRKPYTHQVKRAKDLLGLIHTDVYGPFKIMSRQGASYFITFTDDFSRYGYVYLLKHKHEVFETFKVFQKEVENQLGKTIKLLRSNRGGEYMSKEFLDHLKDHGIIAHRTPPYTPQHNGYPKETIGYSFYYPPENKVLVARNVEFVENSRITQEASISLEDLEIIQKEDTHPSIDTSLNYEEDDQEIDKPQSEIILIRDLGEPANYKAALLDHKYDKWLNAMNLEMQSMKDNEVWDLVDLLPNGKTVGSKWLFKKKTDIDGDVHNYKAHLVIWQIDILNGYLFEEVYMEKLEGFVNPKYPNRKFGFTQNHDEPCVYLKASGSNVNFLILYVDGILIMGNNIPMLKDVKSYLGRCFAMKDLEAKYIAAYDASKEAVWVRKFIFGLGIVPAIEEPISMYCDNIGAITIANESGITKDDNLADPFTKALAFLKHSEHTKNIGMLQLETIYQIPINVTTVGPKAVVSDIKRNEVNVVRPQCAGFGDQNIKFYTMSLETMVHQCPLKDLTMLIHKADPSLHMTENKSYTSNYEEINGGFVTFGGNSKGGKITRKGKIMTGKLDFEDVYFVKELKFNLFSVSQMCDKKNIILFTDTECVVLSSDFKLTNENHVLLKVPRKDNMYTNDLRNVVPQRGLTCLFAKATLDESNL
ncbi:retrotransposon protein, putative, ty1-copia subclass, partial [Tanacetum coccineum]